MKTRGWKWVAAFLLMVGGSAVMAQDSEVPGDNFSLEGALELFKKSESPEKFEKMLNSQDSKVNNLDLNGDGYIDYVRVIDRNEGNVHTFTLQAVISDTEVQDIAVIALEKKSNGKAVLQIIGDEDVYGMETIIEPTQEVRVNAGTTTAQAVVDVWTWPSVQYVYSPSYVVWVSPWSWTMRPVWWYHWHPVVYDRYDSWWRPYRPYYARCYSPRIVYASRIYRPYRVTSVVVHRRHETQIARYRSVHRDRHTNRQEGEFGSGRPTSRTRTSNEVTGTRRELPTTRPANRSAEQNETRVQHKKDKSWSTDRQRSSTEQTQTERPVDRAMQRNHEIQGESRSDRPRMNSSERNNRSSGRSGSGSSSSGRRSKRSR